MSEPETVLTVPWDQWTRLTGLAARFAARDSWEPVIGCVHLVEIGGRLWAEATDRYTAGVVVADEQVVPPEGLDVTVPVSVLRAVRLLARPRKQPGRTVVLHYQASTHPRAEVTVDRLAAVPSGRVSLGFASTATAFPDLRRLLREATDRYSAVVPGERSGSFPVRAGLLARFRLGDVADGAVAVVEECEGASTVVHVDDGNFFGMVVRPKPVGDQVEPPGRRDLAALYLGSGGAS